MRPVKFLTFIPMSLALAGCGTTHLVEPTVVTQKVDVPVAASCVPPNLPDPPQYVDTDEALKAAPDAAERYRLVAAGRLQSRARLAQVEPVIKSCRVAK